MEWHDLLVDRFEYWEIYLHNPHYYLGSVVIRAKRDGDFDMLDMTDEELQEFMIISRKIKKAIIKLFQPDRFNYADLQNTIHHLHIHIIPRYKEPREYYGYVFRDEQWGKCFYPYDENIVVEDQLLLSLCRDIKNAMYGKH